MTDGEQVDPAAEVLRPDMVDMAEYSPRAIVQAVGAPWDPPTSGRWLQLVLQPSFGAELVITVRSEEQTTSMQAATAECSLWTLHNRQRSPYDARWLLEPSPTPRRTATLIALSGDDAESTWRGMEALLETTPAGPFGLDGMPITLRTVRAGEIYERGIWSPKVDTPAHQLIDRLLRLLVESNHADIVPVAQVALEHMG